MSARILLVEDEAEIADLVELYLRNEGYEVNKCAGAAAAEKAIQEGAFDLALLDVMLPDGDGFSLCRRIREKSTCPVLMLTAKDGELDKINGLSLGADDYITKPFRPLELVARVKAQLRRYFHFSPAADPRDLLEVRGLSLQISTHTCTLDEKPLSLTPTEFSILRILCERRGTVVSAEELFHEIWKDEYYSKSNNTIMVHIRHLREKMGESGERPAYIKTVWGVGYKIEG